MGGAKFSGQGLERRAGRDVLCPRLEDNILPPRRLLGPFYPRPSTAAVAIVVLIGWIFPLRWLPGLDPIAQLAHFLRISFFVHTLAALRSCSSKALSYRETARLDPASHFICLLQLPLATLAESLPCHYSQWLILPSRRRRLALWSAMMTRAFSLLPPLLLQQTMTKMTRACPKHTTIS